ncbi:MAG: MaoC family dehydratase [Jatrophihabitantaceae bacterium]
MKSLTSPPSLAALYARAALTGPLRRGDTLPDSVYQLADQTIDPTRLSAYQRICGLRVTDELPPAYLHVLAFPLSVVLMVERAFPFPLVGLVHVANSITVARSVRAQERVSFTVKAADLRRHPAGLQLDLVAQASVDDELVWSGRSTYLRRAKPSAPRPPRPPTTCEQLEQVGPVSVVRVPEDIGRKYGAVSGDRNPIHLHALSAKPFGFPKAIAHGMWLKARTLASLEGRLPAAYTVEVAFKAPVLLPTTVRIATERAAHDWLLDVRAAHSDKPHLTGSLRAGAGA